MEIAIQFLTCAAAACGIIATALLTVIRHRDAGYIVSCLGICLIVISGCCWLMDKGWKDDAALSTSTATNQNKGAAPPIVATYMWTENYGAENPRIWFVQDSEASAIYCAMTVNLTNQSDSGMMVEYFIVEQQQKDGKWESVTPATGTSRGKFYNGPSRSSVQGVVYKTLESAIADKNIGIHETVRGCVFFTKPYNGKLRIRVTDTTGRRFEAPINGITGDGWPAQPIMTEMVKGTRQDISSLPIVDL